MTGCQTCGGFDYRHDPVAHGFVDAMRRDWEEGQTVYEAHEWTGNDPDYCARCDVEWDDADMTCDPDGEPSDAQATHAGNDKSPGPGGPGL